MQGVGKTPQIDDVLSAFHEETCEPDARPSARLLDHANKIDAVQKRLPKLQYGCLSLSGLWPDNDNNLSTVAGEDGHQATTRREAAPDHA